MRAELLLLAALALAGCDGRDLLLGTGNPMDAGKELDPDAGRDDRLPTFETAREIEALSSGTDEPDDDPSLSEDQLVLCFNSKRDGGLGKEDIWCADRTSIDEPWNAPRPVVQLNSEERETGIALSADGRTLWFSSDRGDGDGGLDVYVSTRETRDAEWAAPEHIDELSTEDDELVSSIDAKNRLLVLARRSDDDDDYDIYTATRAATDAAWQAATPLAEVNTDDEESDGFLIGAGLELIFTRDEDLMLSRRTAIDETFDRGEALASVNSEDDDRDAWADAEFTYLVFSSDRRGSYRLYEAKRR